MWKVEQQKVIDELGLDQFGAQKWMSSESLSCPECGKSGKFGVIFNSNGGAYHCFRCDAKGSIFGLLSKIGREDLIIKDGEKSYSLTPRIGDSLIYDKGEGAGIGCEECKPPAGFIEIRNDSYLEGRGWEEWQYEAYHAGISSDPRLKDMLVFLLYEEGKVVGYLARSRRSKEWHKKNLEDFKAGRCSLKLRYSNSLSTEFEKVVGGIDEVVEGETGAVIVVEGIMDKANVDRKLGLNRSPSLKCCFTCGCKMSEAQAEKLARKGVQEAYLMFDPDAISQTAAASAVLSKKITTFIVELNGDKDPGEMSLEDFRKAMENPVPAALYRINKISSCLK